MFYRGLHKDVDKGSPLRKVQILGFWFRGLGGVLP